MGAAVGAGGRAGLDGRLASTPEWWCSRASDGQRADRRVLRDRRRCAMTAAVCRFCQAVLTRTFVDLGRAPLSNAFLAADRLRSMEPHYPLHVYVCENCLLVQLEEFQTATDIFGDYLYFSSFSDLWLRHAE